MKFKLVLTAQRRFLIFYAARLRAEQQAVLPTANNILVFPLPPFTLVELPLHPKPHIHIQLQQLKRETYYRSELSL